MEKREVKVSGQTEIKTFAYLHESAALMLEQAKSIEDGQFYYCMNANLLDAFCFEAYLNHIGVEIVLNWDRIERKLNPIDKLSLIALFKNIPINLKRRPFQTISTILKFRNILVHGKSETIAINEIQKLGSNENIRQPKSWWQRQCNIKSSERYFEDTEAAIRHIDKYVSNDLDPFFSLRHGYYSSEHFQRKNKNLK